jgi:hypothetical protein
MHVVIITTIVSFNWYISLDPYILLLIIVRYMLLRSVGLLRLLYLLLLQNSPLLNCLNSRVKKVSDGSQACNNC